VEREGTGIYIDGLEKVLAVVVNEAVDIAGERVVRELEDRIVEVLCKTE
jgi:hypothetical protein